MKEKREKALTRLNLAALEMKDADRKYRETKEVCDKMTNDIKARIGTAGQQWRKARDEYVEARGKLLALIPTGEEMVHGQME